jgi:hypothetical protein
MGAPLGADFSHWYNGDHRHSGIGYVAPAQRRDIQRHVSRRLHRFFEKDALLFEKHPAKYRQLFFMEERYRMTDEFRMNLRFGWNCTA